LIFIGVWVAIGAAIVLIAMRGGRRRTRASLQGGESTTARRVAAVLFTVFYLAVGVAVPAVVLASDHSDRDVRGSGVKLTAAEQKGRQIFGERCNECHTLAAAGTAGKVGPNLDQLKPPKVLVLDAIANGRRQGNGTMPAGIVSGQDASDVAAFVSAVAGKTAS
jgi:mono/diheme cytochrome c family protein